MPSVRIKKYPKTTGITALGSCGHEFSHRFNLPYSIVGTVRNEKHDLAVEKEKQFQLGVTAKNLCPECYASEGLRNTVQESQTLADSYNLEKFVPLKGTVRMQSFAESIRLNWWHDRTRAVHGLLYGVVKESQTGLNLALYSILESYPQPETSELSEDIENLWDSLKHAALWHDAKTEENISWTLASWLLVRHMTDQHAAVLYRNSDSLDWVKMYKSRYAYSNDFKRQMPEAGTIFIAALVGMIPGWKDRYTAEAVFKGMIARNYEDTLKLIMSRKGQPLAKVLEEAAVYNLLAGHNDEETPPF